MTDKRTTELREVARNIHGNLGRCLYRRKDADEMLKVSELLMEAANTIESMGNGTLTAEQVRGVLLYHLPHREYYSIEQTDAWQAIADELNKLSSGTCYCTTSDDAWCFVCSECDKSFPRNRLHLAHNHGEINYCPNCGKLVRKEVVIENGED